ncbi:WD40 repeat-like protein [Meredithblackwellia eburnea MCA 4105]
MGLIRLNQSLEAPKSKGGAVNTAIFNTGATYLLTGGADRSVRLWNAKKGTLVKSYDAHAYEVLGLACAPDNTKISSCGGDRNVFLWDVPTGEILKRFTGHLGKINAVSFNEEGSVLASGSADMSIRLWDLKSQQRLPLQILDQARDSVTSLAIKGPVIAAGSVDGNVRVYDIRMGELRVDFFDRPVTSVTFSQDSSLLLTTTLDSTIHLMDLSEGTQLSEFKGHKNEDYRTKADFGKGESIVWCGDEEGKIRAWGVETSSIILEHQAHEDGRAVLWTAHHPKEDMLVTAGRDGQIKVWDTSNVKV